MSDLSLIPAMTPLYSYLAPGSGNGSRLAYSPPGWLAGILRPPPAIPGYRPEGSRLCPAWRPCALRMLRVQVIDGVLGIAGLCGNPQAEQFSLEIAPDPCQSCPVRRS